MKALFVASLLALVAVATAQRPTARTTYVLNPASSRLVWTGYAEVGTYAPSGQLCLFPGGTLVMASPTAVQAARILVDVRTLSHQNTQLQDHLRGADFFDVAHYPTASFELLRVAGGKPRAA